MIVRGSRTGLTTLWAVRPYFKPGGMLVVMLFAVLIIGPAGAAGATPQRFWMRCVAETETDVSCNPRGIAASPLNGHIYVADAGKSRVAEFDAWGQLVRTIGWGVVASGPDNNPRNEIQQVTVDAAAGAFQLKASFNQITTAIPFDASATTVQAALEGMPEKGSLNGEIGTAPGDLAVSGPSGGPWTIEFIGHNADSDIQLLQVTESTLSGGAASATVATTQQPSNFEICTPANGDVCITGQAGSAAGQFGATSPIGIAVDSGGNVYALDRGLPSNQRVQKFDPEGHFLRMWGQGVNSGTSGNSEVCTNAGPPTDDCGAGGEGTGPGQFGALSVVGSYIAIDTLGTLNPTDDRVYVGDQERIQSFNTEGAYQSEISLPGEKVRALAVDLSGDLYASFCGAAGCAFGQAAKAGVRKLSSVGIELGTIAVSNPQALAAGPSGELFVVDGTADPTIRQFSSAGTETLGFAFNDGFGASSGIAVGSACFSPPNYGLFVSSPGEPGFVRAFGSPPDEAHTVLCPPPQRAPAIEGQGALSVESNFATVQAKINPLFWKDTSYYVQYGTAACIEGEAAGWDAPCVEKRPAVPAQLGAGAIDIGAKTAKILLNGLAPATDYRYRFVAESSGGGPVFGVGGTEALDGKESTFTTTSPPTVPETNCPNQAFRSGDGALLPDCRAYEMVSPVDKNGGDIRPPREFSYIQASPDGNRITFTAVPSFGDQPSNKIYNQYLASRGGGWDNHGINAPLGKHLTDEGIFYPIAEVGAFAPDLCGEWMVDYNATPLVPPAQPGYVNLYRHNLCGGEEFEALTRAVPPSGAATVTYVTNNSVQGFSKDLSQVLVVAEAGLTDDAVEGKTNRQIYDYADGQLHLVSVLPDDSADPGLSSRGAAVGGGVSGGFGGHLANAVSEDGSRVFWTSSTTYPFPNQEGNLYLRSNPTRPRSDRLHGAATGTGDLTGSAAASAKTTSNSKSLTQVAVANGVFAVGQGISGANIPAETTITAVEPENERLKISNNATATQTGVAITGAASPVVSNLVALTGGFQVGQEIAGPGIPPGATVAAVNEAEHILTLSASANKTGAGVHLSATSECTDLDKACTVAVSTGSATFWTATPDSSLALYSEGNLGDEQGGATLYRYRSDVDPPTRTPLAQHIIGVLGASENLSRTYFISTDVLTPGEQNSMDDEAQPDEPNLYLDEEGSLTFIATLMGGHSGDAAGSNGGGLASEQGAGGTYRIGSFNPRFNASRVTADGGHIAFQSRAPLTHFDNTDAESGEPDLEVFTYEAGGTLHCVSCNRSGVRPIGRELPEAFRYPQVSNSTGIWAAARIPGWEHPFHASNVLSQNGGRLFFMSYTPLVSRDTNGAQDVYEWEAPGEGRCDEESSAFRDLNGGCIYLISSGESSFESEFWDASTDGRDVFFTTESSLLSQDPGSIDLYDARVNGGVAQPAQPAACEGDACQSPPPAPNDPAPASSGFQVTERPPGCAKGKVRRKGRCVAKKRRKHAKRAHHRAANHKGRAAR